MIHRFGHKSKTSVSQQQCYWRTGQDKCVVVRGFSSHCRIQCLTSLAPAWQVPAARPTTTPCSAGKTKHGQIVPGGKVSQAENYWSKNKEDSEIGSKIVVYPVDLCFRFLHPSALIILFHTLSMKNITITCAYLQPVMKIILQSWLMHFCQFYG